MIEQLMIPPKLVGHILGISEATIRSMIHDGRMPAINIGTYTSPRWLIPTEHIALMMSAPSRMRYPKYIKRTFSTKQMAKLKIERELNKQLPWEREEEDE